MDRPAIVPSISPALTEVYRSGQLRAVCNATRVGQPIDLVTFAAVNPKFETATPFAHRFCLKYGLNAVHVIPIGNEWYNYPDMPDCLAAVARHVPAGVTLYGSSMGAHAAVRFAGPLRAGKVIAFAPQISINRDVVPFENRWPGHASRIAFAADDGAVTGDARMYVFFDPLHIDAKHASMIGERGNALLVPVPHAGHNIPSVLAEGGALSAVVKRLLTGEPDVAELQAMMAPALALSPTSHFVRASRTKNRAEREIVIRAGLALDPRHGKLNFQLGSLLMTAKRDEEALPFLHAAARGYRYSRVYFTLGTCLVRLGRLAEGLPHLARAVKARPETEAFQVAYKNALEAHEALSAHPPGSLLAVSATAKDGS